jgi:FkbM family methyltransferase
VSFGSQKKIYKKLCEKGYFPSHVAEVGVYHPETSNIYDYIVSGVKTMLVEPDLESIKLIEEHFSALDNVTLYPYAVFNRDGEISLIQCGASSFVGELEMAPTIVNDNYEVDVKDSISVYAKQFSELDPGDIDLISIDIEGSDWFVLSDMVSHPAIISIETHGAIYINPYLSDIKEWMNKHGYTLWYKDRSDSVYVDPSLISLNGYDKVELYLYDIYLKIRRFKKIIKSKFISRNKPSIHCH